jgi:hypothetical protein
VSPFGFGFLCPATKKLKRSASLDDARRGEIVKGGVLVKESDFCVNRSCLTGSEEAANPVPVGMNGLAPITEETDV